MGIDPDYSISRRIGALKGTGIPLAVIVMKCRDPDLRRRGLATAEAGASDDKGSSNVPLLLCW